MILRQEYVFFKDVTAVKIRTDVDWRLLRLDHELAVHQPSVTREKIT
jgi:hypothetical protein